MRTVVVIQARMGSTRLPGKVLLDVAGKPMLEQQIRRIQHCRSVDDVVVATTTHRHDDAIVDLVRRLDVNWFRGDEHDVLARYVGAARATRADVVLRVTSDCPLIDPALTDRVVDELRDYAAECDYASNIVQRTYPRGLDVEALFADTLFRIDRLSKSAAAREHVTLVPRSERPELFLVRSVTDTEDNSDLRWTVDTDADLGLIRCLYDALGLDTRAASYREILGFVRANPELSALNAGIETWSPPLRAI